MSCFISIEGGTFLTSHVQIECMDRQEVRKAGLGRWMEQKSNEQLAMMMCVLLLLLGTIGLTVLINSPA
jgi:hypothetical protein